MSSVLVVLTFKPLEWNQPSKECNSCSIVAMSRGRVFFARKENLGIVSVLHHMRLRGKEGEVVGKDLEKEWTERGTLEDTDRIGERI